MRYKYHVMVVYFTKLQLTIVGRTIVSVALLADAYVSPPRRQRHG